MSSSSQNQDQSTSSVQDKKEPTDYDILAYEQSIKEKEASQQPLVSSDRESIEVLLGEYAQNPAFLEKLKSLQKHGYQQFRRCRGDGNCFYRAFAYSFMESLAAKITSNPDILKFYQQLCDTTHMEQLKRARFEEMAIADFFEEYQQTLSRITSAASDSASIEDQERVQMAQTVLLSSMQDPMQSNAIVVHLRFLTSAYLKNNAMLYEPFLIMDAATMSLSQVTQFGEPDMESFCRMQVEAMDREADELVLVALSKAMRVRVHVVYLDAHGQPGEVSFHHFEPYPDDDAAVSSQAQQRQLDTKVIDVWLLYRPGHYDILYPSQ